MLIYRRVPANVNERRNQVTFPLDSLTENNVLLILGAGCQRCFDERLIVWRSSRCHVIERTGIKTDAGAYVSDRRLRLHRQACCT